MSDYIEQVKALRYCVNARNCKKCGFRLNNNSIKCRVQRVEDAAVAIEELDAEKTRLLLLMDLQEQLNDRQIEKLAKRNAELRAELERLVSAAEIAGEPKRSMWVRVEDEESYHYECLRCGERPLYSRYGDVVLSGVCPMCGAKMEV